MVQAKEPVRPIVNPNLISKPMKSFVINIVVWWELIMWSSLVNRDFKYCLLRIDRVMLVAGLRCRPGWMILWQFTMKDNS